MSLFGVLGSDNLRIVRNSKWRKKYGTRPEKLLLSKGTKLTLPLGQRAVTPPVGQAGSRAVCLSHGHSRLHLTAGSGLHLAEQINALLVDSSTILM